MQDNYQRSRMEIRLLESRMMRKYHVRFGGGMMEKGPTGHLASFPPNFLSLTENYKEKDLEKGLTDHIQKFLVELGKGFAFVGKQYELKIADTIYYLDLLFVRPESFVCNRLKRDESRLPWWLNSISPCIGVTACSTC